MRQLYGLGLTGIILYAGWWFLSNYEVGGLGGITIKPRDGSSAPPLGSLPKLSEVADRVGVPGQNVPKSIPPLARQANVVRIASFNIQVFGQSKLAKPQAMEVIADVIRRFDIVAIQEIRSRQQDVMPRLVNLINSQGRYYDFVISEPLGRTNSTEQYAFIFDAQSVEVDSNCIYTINDPDDLMHRPPFVAAFRVRGPPPEQAFTFKLINVHTDPDETDLELNVLDDVFNVVRNDGRGEDDVILLGDLNVDDRHLGELGRLPGLRPLLAGVATNTRGTKQYDNLVIDARATTEYLSVAGVFDILRQYNLNEEQALEVSDHLPIWGEFSTFEAGRPGRLANAPGNETATPR
ncbi:MAG: endonuclease/exonuclease/phosphatase family protein [Planctomycetales bacterium]|nr:endonuclease/exonuclease/phosphatase family protein [Planctomycetales bacterium]